MSDEKQVARQLAFAGWLAEEDREIDTDDEYTPPELTEMIRDFFGGDIDLDPCAATGSHVHARVMYFKGDDGLSRDWTRGPDSDGCSGLTIRTRYVNPPYSRPGPWIAKILRTHVVDDPGDTIALVKCDPSTKAWALAWQADAILFFSRRIPFVRPGRSTRAPAKFPCALLYFGSHTIGFANFFAELGHVIVRAESMRDAFISAEHVVADLEHAGLVRRVEAYGETRVTLADVPPSRRPTPTPEEIERADAITVVDEPIFECTCTVTHARNPECPAHGDPIVTLRLT